MPSAQDLLAALPIPAALVRMDGTLEAATPGWQHDDAVSDAAVAALADRRAWRGDVVTTSGTPCRVDVRPLPGEPALALVSYVPCERDQLARVSRELEQAQHRQKGLLDSIPDMAWLKDSQSRFLAVNEALARALGATSVDEVIGKTDLDYSPRALAEQYRADDRVVMETRRTRRVEERHVGTDGERWIETIKVPIVDDVGAVIGTAGMARDVTDRKQAEEILRRSHAELEEQVARRTEELARANERLLQAEKLEALGRLAGGVAHDFNNLLTIIQASLGFAERGLPPGHAARAELQHVRDASTRAAELTRQLLSFARKQMPSPSLVDLRSVVLGADKMLRRVLGEDIELVTLTGSAVDPVKIDPGQLETVLLNLVLNARDAMPNGGTLTVETRAVDVGPHTEGELAGLEPGRWTVLRVSDTGVGIADEALPHLFEPFFTTKGPGLGTGLGLATSYGIIRQARGDIRVARHADAGTTFVVAIPSAGRGLATPPRDDEAAGPGGDETILVVEDEPQVRMLVARALEDLGYRILVASSGAEALAVEGSHPGPIDLVITDIVMPQMSGITMATELLRRRPSLPVLFVSGYAAEITGPSRLPAGTHFLAKPFTPDELATRVRALLDAHATAPHGSQVIPLRTRRR